MTAIILRRTGPIPSARDSSTRRLRVVVPPLCFAVQLSCLFLIASHFLFVIFPILVCDDLQTPLKMDDLSSHSPAQPCCHLRPNLVPPTGNSPDSRQACIKVFAVACSECRVTADVVLPSWVVGSGGSPHQRALVKSPTPNWREGPLSHDTARFLPCAQTLTDAD